MLTETKQIPSPNCENCPLYGAACGWVNCCKSKSCPCVTCRDGSRHGRKVTAIQSNSRLEKFETLEDDYYFSRPVAADNWVGLEEWLEQEEEQTT